MSLRMCGAVVLATVPLLASPASSSAQLHIEEVRPPLEIFSITADAGQQLLPTNYGRAIAWQDGREGGYQIFMYDQGADSRPGTGDPEEGEYRLTSVPSYKSVPDSAHHLIVWQDARDNPNSDSGHDIYGYYLGPDGIPSTGDAHEGEYRITSPEAALAGPPDIDRHTIVWADERAGRASRDVYMHYFGPDGIPGTADAQEGEYLVGIGDSPSLDGNLVAYRNFDALLVTNLGPDGIPNTLDAGEATYTVVSSFSTLSDLVMLHNLAIVWFHRVERQHYLYYLGADGIPNTQDANEGEYVIASAAPGAAPPIFRMTIDGGRPSHFHPTLQGNQQTWWTLDAQQDIRLGIVTAAPVVQELAPMTSMPGTPVAFTVTATDAQGGLLTLSPDALPPGASFTDHQDGTGTFTWTPTEGQEGVYDATFTVTDEDGWTDTDAVTIQVAGNSPPTLSLIGNKTVVRRQPLNFTVSATDPDGDPLSFTAAPLPAGATFKTSTQAFSWTPASNQVGTYRVTFTVRDPSGADAFETIQINVVKR